MLNQEIEFGTKISGVNYRERLGVYGLILNADENIALVTTGKGYFLPGGGVEGDETHEECLKRECTEELGYNIKLGEYIGKASNYTLSFKTNEYLRAVGHFYRAQLLEPNYLKIEEDHELVWLPLEEAIDKMDMEFQAWAIKETLRVEFYNRTDY